MTLSLSTIDHTHTHHVCIQIHCHLDIIDVLLDSGADVNSLDCAGVSALTACHHLLYGPLPEVNL